MLKARRIGHATFATRDLDRALTSFSGLAGLLLHVWEEANQLELPILAQNQKATV